MTEFEKATLEFMEWEKLNGMVQSIYSASGLFWSDMSLGFTLIFGYLIAAYYIGAKLTRLQVSIFNAFFIAAVAGIQMSARANFNSMLVMFDRLEKDFSGVYRPPVLTEAFYPLVPMMGVAFVSGALYFMWSVRHHNIE